MKKILCYFVFLVVLWGCGDIEKDEKQVKNENSNIEYGEVNKLSHPLVIAAREQIGRVNKYDTSYYVGGYPPSDRGACTDLVERALFANNFDLKSKIDVDMNNFSSDYPHAPDPNINFRRVRNVKIFFEKYAQNLPKEINSETLDTWKPGDIVTYEQIPGSLWHIAIVSDKKNSSGVPFLIHNYGKGVVEDDLLTSWPAPISGHFRIEEIES